MARTQPLDWQYVTIDGDPWWLKWVLPLTTVLGAIGAAAAWIGRKILLTMVKAELNEMLDKRFLIAENKTEERHEDNTAQFQQLNNRLDTSEQDRVEIRKDLARVEADVAYIRGRTRR